MARNPIQFQPGLSLPVFLAQYGTQTQRCDALRSMMPTWAANGRESAGAVHRFPFVAAVQTDADGRPHRLQLRRVTGFTHVALSRFATACVAPDSHVVSDGLPCFRVFDSAPYHHERHVTGGGRPSVRHPAFYWVNTLLGNVKNAITGTYHAINGQHTPRYLAEFEYRFNRRYDLAALLPRYLTVAVRTPPRPYRLLKLAESYT